MLRDLFIRLYNRLIYRMKIIKVDNMNAPCYPIGASPSAVAAQVKILSDSLVPYFYSKNIENKRLILVVTGSSGLIIGTFLSVYFPGCKIIHIKKPIEDSHHHHKYDSVDPNALLLFVDDFMSSGNTYKRVWEEVKVYYKRPLDGCITLGSSEKSLLNTYKPTTLIVSNNIETL